MSVLFQPWVLWPVSGFLVWPFLSWALARQTTSWGKAVGATVIIALHMAIPWTVPAEHPAIRFVLLVPCFFGIGRTIDIFQRHSRDLTIFDRFRRFLIWVLVPVDSIYWDDPEKQKAARKRGKTAVWRLLLKMVALLCLSHLNNEFPLHENFWSSHVWMMFVLYLMLSGIIDLVGMPFLLCGVDVGPAFDAPPLARNPRDFWGRRWNLYFTATCNRLIFQKLGGSRRPVIAASAVFTFSALLHEYMVWVSLERFDGRMLVFFSLHGLITIGTTMAGRLVGRATLMPRAAAIALHIVWFTVTSPLFFGPVEEIFHFTTWRLW